MARTPAIIRATEFARRVQRMVAEQLRANITAGVDGKGNEFKPLWTDTAIFPNGLESDRAGEPTLIESGKLLRSIRPGRIVRRGNQLLCYIKATDYGLKQHHGFTEKAPVIIGRTKALRDRVRLGNFGRIPRGDKVVIRRRVMVPARPWISLDGDTIDIILENAKGGGNG